MANCRLIAFFACLLLLVPCIATHAQTSNNRPIAVNDIFELDEDAVLTIGAINGVLSNDSDPDGDALFAKLLKSPARGSITLSSDGSFVYTPVKDFNGVDSFTYTISDGRTGVAAASVKLTVRPVNDNPVAFRDTYKTAEDDALSIAAPGLLFNDWDPDNTTNEPGNTDVLSVTAETKATAAGGTVAIQSNGAFNYTPNQNYNGIDSFTYSLNDGKGGVAFGSVAITVLAVNDSPAAVDDSYTITEDVILNVNAANGLLANDTDMDGDALTASLLISPLHGVITVNADGSFAYRGNRNYNGPDSYSYVVRDGNGGRDTGFVSLTVTAVDDPPVAKNDNYYVSTNDSLIIAAPGVLFNDVDVDGPLSAQLLSSPASGSFSFNSDGSFRYVPVTGFAGTVTFSYRLCTTCAAATVTINVGTNNRPPLAAPDSYSTSEDVPLTVPASGVLANDTDPDESGIPGLGAFLVSTVGHGTLTLHPNGSFEYVPELNYNGADNFVYAAVDANGATSQTTVFLNVTAVNDAPEAADYTMPVDEDVQLTGSVAANVIDVDNSAGSLLYTVITNPAHGSLSLNANGSFTYTPNVNYNGPDQFSYRVCDPGGLCDDGTVAITVNPVNDAPVAQHDSYTATEDQQLLVPVALGVLANDSDADGDPIAVSIVNPVAHGTLHMQPDGSFSYLPDPDFAGVDQFTYQVCDSYSLCSAPVTVTLTVVNVNDVPSAANDEYTTVEDESLTVPAPGVLANDTDADGDLLTAAVERQPQYGNLTVNSDGSFVYTPSLNYYGLDYFTYRISDGNGATDTAQVAIAVSGVNDAPIAVPDNINVQEDIPATGNVLTNDTDPEGDVLTASLVTAPVNGTVVLNADGSFTYTPNANYNGLDSLVYQVCDNGTPSLCDTATTIFNVQPVNDAPIAVRDSTTLDQDNPATGNVLTNDSDLEGDALTASLVTAPVNGTVVLNADGSFTYTPNPSYSGLDSLSYQVCDNGTPSLCDTATAIFLVRFVNKAPLAVDDNVLVTEDIPATGNVLTNDTDPEGHVLTASLVTAPVNGTVVLNADGSFTYTPNTNYNGLDSLVYQVCDNDTPSLCDTAKAFFSIQPINDAPVAVRDSIVGPEDQPLAGNVLTNDSDPEGDVLTASLVTAPVNGTVVLNADGSFTYTPNVNYNGLDSLVYQVCDNGAPPLCDTATTIFNVLPVNDAPIAVRDSTTLNQDLSATGNVLVNDSDLEGNALTASLVTAPVNGTVVLNADGSFTYTPNPNYSGLDSLVYQVCDNGTPSLCDTAIAIFLVQFVNKAPVAVRDSITVTEDIPGTGNVLTNDSDPDGDALTASLVTAPVNGTVVLNADGSFTYTPNVNYNGLDSLVYQVCDNNTPSLCDTATAVFSIQPVNDAPVAIRDSIAGPEDQPLTGNVLANDSDTEGDALTASLVTAPVNGTVVLNADGSFTYTPNSNYNGLDSLVYQVCDNGTPSLCDSATVIFNVLPVNDAPIAVRDSITLDQDLSATGNVLTNDSDPEGDVLTASLVTAPVNGTVVLNADGSFTYTPNPNYSGLDSLSYQVCDNGTPSLCDTATAIFLVQFVNKAPVAVRDSIAVTEDIPGAGNVLTNDSDPDGDALTASLVTAPVNGTVVLNADGSFTYTPNNNYSGLDSLVYQVCDNNSPSLCDTATLILRVLPVNDAPVNTVPGQQETTRNTPLVFNLANTSLISVSDVDAGNSNVQITLTATQGTLKLSGTTGLTFAQGSNSGNESVLSFTGTLSDVNNALNGLQFTPASGYVGNAALDINTSDLGNTGAGGAQTASNSIPIIVKYGVAIISAVTTPLPDGIYKAGDVITVHVNFDQPVTVNVSAGTPRLLLETGVTDRQANYISGSGSSVLVFEYTVVPGDSSLDLNYSSTTALTLNGGTILNTEGVNATLVLPALSSPTSLASQHQLVIDGIAPVVNMVQVPADNTYRTGQTLEFTVSFSEPVTVNTASGIPAIPVTLDAGGVVNASYVSGSGTNALLFRYTVVAGNQDANGITTASAISLNGGGITDIAGNPALAALNNIGATTGVLVDAVAPGVTITSDAPATVTAPFTVTVTFSESVNGFAQSDVNITNGAATAFTAVSSTEYRITITPSANGEVVVSVPAAVATDAAGNDNTAATPLSRMYRELVVTITAAGNTSFCQGGSVVLNSSEPAGNQWYRDGQPVNGATAASFTAAVAGVYTVQVPRTDGSAAISSPLTVTVFQLPQPPVVTASGNTAFCEGGSVQLNSSATAGNQWYLNGQPLSGASGVNYTASQGGTYAVQVTDNNGCQALSATTVVTVHALPATPVITNSGSLSFCAGESVTLRTRNPAAGYQWFKDGAAISGATAATYTADATGTYTVQVTNAEACLSSISIGVAVVRNELPVFTIASAAGDTLSRGFSSRLSISGATGAVTWSPATGLDFPFSSNPVATPLETTKYTATLTTAAGCKGNADITLHVLIDYKVRGRVTITPNGDGVNDVFVIENITAYPNNHLQIFDRAGKLVYEKRNYANDWTGQVRDRRFTTDTYFYILTIDGKVIKKGAITVVH